MKDQFGEELSIGDEVLVYDNGISYVGVVCRFNYLYNYVSVVNSNTNTVCWTTPKQLSKLVSINLGSNNLTNSANSAVKLTWNPLKEMWERDDANTHTVKTNPNPNIKELPCNLCGRNNDIGIKICWCCGEKIT